MQAQRFYLFDTVNTISAPVLDDAVMADVKTACLRYEHLFNRFDDTSELSRINRSHGQPVDVDPELATLIATALAYCEASDGLFDITMGAVTQLWDIKHHIVPDDDDIKRALTHVGWQQVHVNGTRVQLDDPEGAIELGGIAKGYIADRIVDILKAHCIEHAIVNLGGNVVVLGGRPDGTPWKVGLRNPSPTNGIFDEHAFATVDIANGSVVTSGIYERTFEHNGMRYHHILDPRTGHPSMSDLVSATVISPTSIDGDGYSTALVIMGADAAFKWAAEHPQLELILVNTSGTVLCTPNLTEKYPVTLVDR